MSSITNQQSPALAVPFFHACAVGCLPRLRLPRSVHPQGFSPEPRAVGRHCRGPRVSVPGGEEKTVDLRHLCPTITTPGTYSLYAVPKDKPDREFSGTPLVIEVREDKRHGAPPGPMLVHVTPLCYAEMTTDKGTMTLAFYY